ncbi:MAG: MMPL family transporter [Candidatus Wallbacteria bacterium]|nr:MMPL family transporter [Candidatus Wallbacteria bacterium]
MADTAGNADDPFADGGWKVSVKKDALLVAIHPADSSDDFDFIVPFFETCHGVIDRLKTKYPGVEIGMTGQPASIYFQRDVVGKDLELTSLVSLVLVFIVVVWGFRGLGLPFLAMVSLVCAIVWTFGAIHFSPGHLNLITTAFVSMLLGLGADYGIYVLSQFAERRRADGEYFESIRGAVLAAGPGILTGAFTTCAGFFTLMLTDFPGFRELGQIAGVGILLCMLAMLVLLPCLLASAGRLTRSLGAGVTGLTERVLGATATFALENSLPVLVAFGIGSFVLLVEGFNTEFDYNLLNMEPENTEPVVYEHVLQKDFEITPDTVMVTTKTLDEASEKKKQLEKLASVGNVDSLTNYIPSRPEEKQAVLSRIASEVHGVRFDKPSAVDVDSLAASLDAVRKKLKELKLGLLMAYGGEHVLAAADGEENLQRALEAMRKGPKGEVGRRLTAYQEASFRDLSGGFEGFRRLLTARPFRLEQLPEAIRARYRGKSGRYVLFVSPRVDVRLESQAKLFIAQTGAVSPGVTGVPILIDEVMTLLRRGFKQATAYSLIAVILLVFFDFRTMKETLLALTPLVVSLSATVGLMALTGTKFNPANFVSIPILTGLGMAYGVYLLHRLRQDPEAGPVGAVRTTGRSILLSCLTSLAGFGSLMLARNRGLHSLGRILVGGLGICLLASLVMLPTLAELVGYRGRRPREDEAPLRDSLLGFHV